MAEGRKATVQGEGEWVGGGGRGDEEEPVENHEEE